MTENNSETTNINLINNENLEQKVDILGNLQPDDVQDICMYLPSEDILRIWNYIPQWSYLMNDEYFWKSKCQKDLFYPVDEASKTPYYKKFSEKLNYWQATYLYNATLDYNWKNGIYQEILLGKRGLLREVHYFDDEMVVATTANRQIKIFNSTTGVLMKRFSILCKGPILQVMKQDDLLVCITELHAIAWNINDESVLNTWTWRTKVLYTYKLRIHHCSVAVAVSYINYNRELLLLNVKSAIYNNTAHNVHDVWLYNNKAVLYIYNSVSVMNIFDNSMISLLCYSDDNHNVEQILVKNQYVIGVCKSSDHTHFSVWNVETSHLVAFSEIEDITFYNEISTDELSNWQINFNILDENKLVYNCYDTFQGDDGNINIFNYLTGKIILRIDRGCVNITNFFPARYIISYLITCNNNYVISITKTNSGSGNRKISIFCLNSGEFVRSFIVTLDESTAIYYALRRSKITMFTATKMLKFKLQSKSKKIFSILNYE